MPQQRTASLCSFELCNRVSAAVRPPSLVPQQTSSAIPRLPIELSFRPTSATDTGGGYGRCMNEPTPNDPTSLGWKVDPPPVESPDLSPSFESVDLVAGISGPRVITASGLYSDIPTNQSSALDAQEAPNVLVRVRIGYNDESERFLPHDMEVTATEGGEVPEGTMGAVDPLRIVRWLLPLMFTVEPGVASPYVETFITGEAARVRQGTLPKPSVEDAADVYRLAIAFRQRPIKAVADALGIDNKTTASLLAIAREDGLLRASVEADDLQTPEISRDFVERLQAEQ